MALIDALIQMDLFRMMRSGHYIGKQGAKDLLRDIQLDYPEVSKEDTNTNVRALTQRLMKDIPYL